MAIIGIMAGTLVFFATPSSLEKERKKGAEVLNLMQKARLYAMLQGRIYAIEKPAQEAVLKLVMLVSEEAMEGSPLIVEEDLSNGEEFERVATGGEKKEKKRPTYAEHKGKAEQLGLMSVSYYPQWEEQGDEIRFEEIALLFTSQNPLNLEVESEYIREGFGELLNENETEAEIRPELVFFPDGRVSNEGSFHLTNELGEIIFGLSWDAAGKFTRE